MQAFGSPILVRSQVPSRVLQRVHFRQGQGAAFDEAWLQRLIHTHPECLPIDEIEPGFETPVTICMELPTSHGPVDNFLLTPEGDVVLVETKLWRNPEARRKVVAQALDYAACLFEMDYEELERAVLKGDFGSESKPNRLYDLLEHKNPKAEEMFIDAVNSNLRRGRILILVAGDGIRTEAERLAASLQSHAGFHFTFALVELAVYQLPEQDAFIVQPRTLAKTSMIDRGVVFVDDKRVAIQAPVTPSSRPESITEEQFFEAMESISPGLSRALRILLSRLEILGVYPDYQRSLNIKWDPPRGRPVNLGYVLRNGDLATDAANASMPEELKHKYIEALARVLGGKVHRDFRSGIWSVRIDGRAPRMDRIVDKLDAWPMVIEDFIDGVRQHLANTTEE